MSWSGRWTQKLNLQHKSNLNVKNKSLSITSKLLFPSCVFNRCKKSDLIFIGSDVSYAKSFNLISDVNHLLRFNEAYKMQLSRAKLVSPIYTLG